MQDRAVSCSRELTCKVDQHKLKKVGNPLFKLNKLSVRDMVENLGVLYGDRGEQMTADIEDVRCALNTLLGDKQPETEADIIEDSFSKDCAIVLKIQGKLAMGIFKEVQPEWLDSCGDILMLLSWFLS